MNNPFSMTFGQIPLQNIDRPAPREQVLSEFQAEHSPQMVYIVTGVRGSGKTVFMTEIVRRLRNDDDWIVVELNAEVDLLRDLVSELYSDPVCYPWFRQARLNFSLPGISVGFEHEPPIIDYGTAAKKMAESIKKHGKRLLIAIDEASNSKQMRTFTAEYQIWLRAELPVYLLMTGLYENIYQLQNVKSLTFLRRAAKIFMKPFNLDKVKSRYQALFHLTDQEALEMAMLTKGYPYGFQVLGYYSWIHDKDYRKAVEPYCQHLEEYVYEKIWEELSVKDQQILVALAESEVKTVQDVREKLSLTNSQFSPYKERLIRKGLISVAGYGLIAFSLPFFDRYALLKKAEQE